MPYTTRALSGAGGLNTCKERTQSSLLQYRPFPPPPYPSEGPHDSGMRPRSPLANFPVPDTPKRSTQWTTPALPESRVPMQESKYKADPQ